MEDEVKREILLSHQEVEGEPVTEVTLLGISVDLYLEEERVTFFLKKEEIQRMIDDLWEAEKTESEIYNDFERD